MTPVGRDILERLENGDDDELALTPALIAVNTEWGHQTIREHMADLREHVLIEYREKVRGIYRLTELGREYLANKIDVEYL